MRAEPWFKSCEASATRLCPATSLCVLSGTPASPGLRVGKRGWVRPGPGVRPTGRRGAQTPAHEQRLGAPSCSHSMGGGYAPVRRSAHLPLGLSRSCQVAVAPDPRTSAQTKLTGLRLVHPLVPFLPSSPNWEALWGRKDPKVAAVRGLGSKCEVGGAAMEAEGRVGWAGGSSRGREQRGGRGGHSGVPTPPRKHGTLRAEGTAGRGWGGVWVGRGPQLRSKRQRCRRERVKGHGGVGGWRVKEAAELGSRIT